MLRPGPVFGLLVALDAHHRTSSLPLREGWAKSVFTGSLRLDLLLGDVRSLKEKRSLVRPVIAELRKKFEVSAAEAGYLDLHRRALVGVAVVAADAGHCREVLDACERLVAARPELEVLSAHQQLFGEDD